jgi:glycosyltransferase involved in cell wall biosynthesis
VTAVEVVFWTSGLLVVYSYVGYPLTLMALGRLRRRAPAVGPSPAGALPGVSIVIPIYNERAVLPAKVANLTALDYPQDRVQIVFVSDGSTDGSSEWLRASGAPLEVVDLPGRSGKAAGLNAGVAAARHDVVVFTDASIMLEPRALQAIVAPLADPSIGCVSGEDHVADGGEGLYGRYELMIRRLESRVHSVVGASGSFYAQRKALCAAFPPGLAPDFFSVLRTVRAGYRAVTEPRAAGQMTAVAARDEFGRKIRTVLRGITTLGEERALLNPLRYGVFAFELWAHKVLRWLVPILLVMLLAASLALATRSPFYLLCAIGQGVFYAAALAGRTVPSLNEWRVVRIAFFFTIANLAILVAWARYVAGVRQELWAPSRR